MVSLVNFKLVDDELRRPSAEHERAFTGPPAELVGEWSIVARRMERAPASATLKTSPNLEKPQVTIASSGQSVCPRAGSRMPQDYFTCVGTDEPQTPPQTTGATNNKFHDSSECSLASQERGADGRATAGGVVVANAVDNGFTVTWRALKFSIEPKWHEKIAQSSSFLALAKRIAPPTSPASKPAEVVHAAVAAGSEEHVEDGSASQHQQEQQEHSRRQQAGAAPSASACVTRVVLDRLDGSFRSGELTAILGPSGAGKTTLLDCLTGHRKKGLSGSIRISSSHHQRASIGSAGLANNCYNHEPHNTNSKKDLILSSPASRCGLCESSDKRPLPFGLPQAGPSGAQQASINGENLKVSIIPQNDHLIGHLTVYETLSYASKMKNCLKHQFDHKLNVRRVAQQLGLMSCLGTRINKLSGGQYKRVSIAQELLSSPDILILDEPTSGLDAMTCYQTVQVLRKLTDDRQRQALESPDQKPIAVILTIHQPNSDVFQQFNHVYVVAQGGKCIYEGPPGAIESVINRIGLELPNSYYNPATMIVEIAASKFGQNAIYKLNSIQKKQYVELCSSLDEQNSTGDSAVDCPSSSSNDDYSGGEDDDEEGPCCCCGTANEQGCAKNSPENCIIRPIKRLKTRQSELNNNNDNDREKSTNGLVNMGFIMDSDEKNHSAEVCDKSSGVVVVIPGSDDDRTPASQASSVTVGNNERERRNRKRRRMKRRSATDNLNASILVIANKQNLNNQKLSTKKSSSSIGQFVCGGLGGGGGGGGAGDGDGSGSDGGGSGGTGGGRAAAGCNKKRLKLNSLKADQNFPFWRHTYLHFHRSWLSIVRDPMLCSMQLALHIVVPVMVSLVYGTYVGKPNACPRAGPIDIMAYALEPTDKALQLQEDLRTTLENIGYIFFKLYGIIFAAMTVTVLTFPLDMHVLVKEFRNGWYGLASYFLGRTLADIPFQLTLPLLAMSLSYYATGQPSSYMQWRFFSITAVLILSSLIAQSQGLLFGAILMDKMKAAVFVAPAATTPIILFAGFLVRTQSIPSYLRPLSNLSYLRYAIEACLISRYGFNQCECEPAIFNQTVPELPPIARSMLDYWLSSFKAQPAYDSPSGLLDGAANATISALETTTTAAVTGEQPDLFGKLIDSLARANSFGRNITSCDQVVPYPMIDYDLKDSQLYSCFAILLAMLIFTRLLTFFIVCYKVKRKV